MLLACILTFLSANTTTPTTASNAKAPTIPTTTNYKWQTIIFSQNFFRSEPQPHYIFPHPYTITSNNEHFNYTITAHTFNISFLYYSTYRICPSYYNWHSCEIKALNYRQNSMRTYGHTNLKECTAQQ